jgi:aminoglycoside/choline kinase family phosphotransferase
MESAIKSNPSSLDEWVAAYFGNTAVQFEAIMGDASFKAFYRLTHEHKNYMLMAAPPSKEKVVEFFEIDKLLIQRGVNAPKILAVDLTQGYFLMEDFGDTLYYSVLSQNNMDALYRKALATLLNLQSGEMPKLPNFDEVAIQTEFKFFTEWCFKLLNLRPNAQEEALLAKTLAQFNQVFLEQPQVLVHRDYHARNLFVLEDKFITPGVIDFQDAVIGPITYDLASLLKDCYLTWPQEKLKPLLEDFYLALRAEKKGMLSSFEQFYRWVDWTGLQRHIKVLGIFSRLYLRDNKTRYLYDMPRVLAYVLAVTQNYPALSAFHEFMKKRVLPAFSVYWESQHISILATPKDTGHYHSLLVQVA